MGCSKSQAKLLCLCQYRIGWWLGAVTKYKLLQLTRSYIDDG